MRKVKLVNDISPTIKHGKKVAAYARVSVENDESAHSLSAQVSFYSELIQKNPEWKYVGVYSDYGISGTSTKHRSEFNRLINDCKEGKVDVILTKSISRFARNTVDLLSTVRHLKDLGVELRFEREGINSLSGEGELMLTILASFAQEEVRSISNNVKWSVCKRFEKGIHNGRFRIFGYRWLENHLVVESKEAIIVKRIFQNFLDGKSRLETEREFAAEGIRTMNGCIWRDGSIAGVLKNITYTGNMLFQKKITVDSISHRRKLNKGEVPKYYVENTHEAIIEKVTYDWVQREMVRRQELGGLANKSINKTCFTAKIKCGHCGKSFIHRNKYKAIKSLNGYIKKYSIYKCNTRTKNIEDCPMKQIPEEIIKEACKLVLGVQSFEVTQFLDRVDRIIVPRNGALLIKLYDGSEKLVEWTRKEVHYAKKGNDNSCYA